MATAAVVAIAVRQIAEPSDLEVDKMRTTHKMVLLVDATSEDEADAITQNLISGKTLGHEVNAKAYNPRRPTLTVIEPIR